MNLESSAPNCDCGKQLLFDPFTRTFYCKIYDPEFHKDVMKDLEESR